MKIEDARLCINCDEVVDVEACPVCTSKITYPIIMWLNKPLRKPRKHEEK